MGLVARHGKSLLGCMGCAWAAWVEGCCLLLKSRPRESTGWGQLPGNRPAMGNLWIRWCRVSGRHRVEQANPVRPMQIHNCCQCWVHGLPQKSQITVMPAAVCLGLTELYDLPKRHCSVGCTSGPLPKVSSEMCRLHKLRAAACPWRQGPREGTGLAGCLAMGLLQVICGLGGAGSQGDTGWGRLISQANADSELVVQEGSTQARWHLSVDCTRSGLTKEQWQLSVQPSSWRHATQSFSVCLLRFPSCWPSTGAQGECLRASVHAGPLRGHLGFQIPSVSPRWRESPLIFTIRSYGNSSSWD